MNFIYNIYIISGINWHSVRNLYLRGYNLMDVAVITFG